MQVLQQRGEHLYKIWVLPQEKYLMDVSWKVLASVYLAFYQAFYMVINYLTMEKCEALKIVASCFLNG